MQFKEIYISHFRKISVMNSDFSVLEVKPNIFVGVDRNLNAAIVLDSTEMNRSPVIIRTKKLQFELNAKVSVTIDNKCLEKQVHTISLLGNSEAETEIFFELAETLFTGSENSEEYIFDTIRLLSDFFSQRNEYTDQELQGLYAELYTIYSYVDRFDFSKYWQSKDRMKFDFSINSKVKVEVKSTQKTERKHHFKHDQLSTEVFEIYILSYILRIDDKGLSLFDLINSCKKIFIGDTQKILRLNKFLLDISEDRLKTLKFSEEFSIDKRRFYNAQNVPKFSEKSPEGIVNAEYDSILEDIPFLTDDFIIDRLNSAITEENEIYV